VRYQYGYANYGNDQSNEMIPFLHTISVPSATGSGLATATINYNSMGEVTSTSDANGNQTIYTPATAGSPPTYQTNSGRVQIKDIHGNLVLQYDKYFNSQMSQTKLLNAAGQAVWTRSYGDPNDPYRVSSMTDGNGRTWSYTWDQFGHLTSERTPKSLTITRAYSYSQFSLGELTSITTGSKTATSYTYYEPSGMPHTLSTPIPGQSGTGSTQTTTYTYDGVGNILSIVRPGNNTGSRQTSYGYTTDGTYSQPERLRQPITVTDSLGKITHLRYDTQDNLTSATDPLGNVRQLSYDISNHLAVLTKPATMQSGTGNATVRLTYQYPNGPIDQLQEYDESNLLVSTLSYTYGLEGELLGNTGPSENRSVTYDAAYHKLTLADGNGSTSHFTYDLSGRKLSVSHPGTSGANYDQVHFTSYDAVNNLLSRTDGNGQVTNYVYGDADGMLSQVNYPGQAPFNVGRGYDRYDRMTSISDSTGSETVSYDDLNLQTATARSYTGLPAQTTTYTYWPDESRNTMVNPAGTWSYTYDADGRYRGMSSPAGSSSATYFDNGWQSSRTLPNGATTSYTYNAVGKFSSLTNDTSGSAVLSQFSAFTYDGSFRLTGLTAMVPGASNEAGATSWAYDSSDRMTSEISQRLGGYSESFGYDGAGNPTTFDSLTEGFNADNQQTGSTFTYDGNGNPTTYAGATLAFDPENHVSSFGSALSATYRADGHRATKTNSSGTNYYLYDRGKPIVELSGTGSITALNVYAPDGLVARQQAGTWTFYAFDQQGNVAQRLDSSQNVMSNSCYDAFGFDARWGYIYDRETGYYLAGLRYYNPATGRWLNRDPVGFGGGVSLYSYVSDNPHALDPNGLFLSSCTASPENEALCAETLRDIGEGGEGVGEGPILPAPPIPPGSGPVAPPPCPPLEEPPPWFPPDGPTQGPIEEPPPWFPPDDPAPPIDPPSGPPDEGGGGGDDDGDPDPDCASWAATVVLANGLTGTDAGDALYNALYNLCMDGGAGGDGPPRQLPPNYYD
jgi:RHS repeat-associated protein